MMGFIKKSSVVLSIFMLFGHPILPLTGMTAKAKIPLRIEITKGVFSRIPIAFLGFQTIGSDIDIGAVVQNDLSLSGAFSILPQCSAYSKDHDALSTPNLYLWGSYPGAMVVQGNITSNGTNIFVELKMYDVELNKLLKKGTIQGSHADWRTLAHLISNAIYKELTGEDGIFDTQIIFAAQSGKLKNKASRIAIIDQDGANAQFITAADEYCHIPKASLTSPYIAYGFFNERRSMLRLHNSQTGQKRILPLKGLGISTDFSPDGRHLLFSDAHNGSAVLGVYDLESGATRYLNRAYGGIASSPSYAPDGHHFVVASDQDLTSNAATNKRIGVPKLYISSQNGGSVSLLSKGKGSYFCPVWSPDGRYIAFVKKSKGNYYLGVMNADGTQERMLASDHVIDYPSWAPNSRMLIFSAQQKRFGPFHLFIVDLTGRSLRKLNTCFSGKPYAGNHPTWRSYKPSQKI